MELQRAVSPLQVPLQKLGERQIGCVDPEMQTYFRDVADHAIRVRDQVRLRRTAHLDPAGHPGPQFAGRDNEDMRKISA